jgi:hypothetical protein
MTSTLTKLQAKSPSTLHLLLPGSALDMNQKKKKTPTNTMLNATYTSQQEKRENKIEEKSKV